ncbi:hypothetical protein F4825DRAFT_443416 [Nemania diffusa]|nr:hypothetical protein F4825DRAFT_443416 [Nemania diffusa]
MNATTTLVGWQDSPSRRGTLGIVENCLVTIFACTWSIQHLNVPGKDDTHTTKFLRTLKWMLISILLPELILAHAILQLAMAVQGLDAMQDAGIRVKYPRWLPVLRRLQRNNNKSPESRAQDDGTTRENNQAVWTLTHAYFANMGGFTWNGELPQSPPRSQAYYSITCSHIASQHTNISNLYLYDEATIKEKGKSDAFAKGLAVIQILQLILSLIVRKDRGLPVSQLEILTLVFAICGLATYVSCWYKPRNVTVPLPIAFTFGPTGFERPFDSFYHTLLKRLPAKARARNRHIEGRYSIEDSSSGRILNDNIFTASSRPSFALYLLMILCVALGSLHAIAWNFEFPTFAEKTAWRVTTIVSVAIPPLAIPRLQYCHQPRGSPQDFRNDTARLLSRLADKTSNATERRKIIDIQQQLQGSEKICYMDIFYCNRKRAFNIFGRKSEKFDDDIGRKIDIKLLTTLFNSKDGFERDFTQEYRAHLSGLANLIGGVGSGGTVEEVPWTDVYPRQETLTTEINRWFVFLMTVIYCAARLALLALTLSSLRKMPDGVYITTWTKYIPIVQ